MAQDEVHTRFHRGQWENYVEGRPELSASFASEEEAVEHGRALAEERGTHHLVDESEPADARTHEGEPAGDSDPVI